MGREEGVLAVLGLVLVVDEGGQRLEHGLGGGGEGRFLAALVVLGHVARRVVLQSRRTVLVVVVHQVRLVILVSGLFVRWWNVPRFSRITLATISHLLLFK